MSNKREAGILCRIKATDRLVQELKNGAAKLTKDYAAAGDFLAMQQVIHEVQLEIEEALRVRADLRQLLPPFMTEKDGIYYRHPVTPENKHLLWELPAGLEAEAAKKRGQEMTDHPCKGLPASARHAFEALTINQQPRCRKKTIDLLLERGLIERGPDRIVGRDPLGLIAVPEYFVPIHVHMQFCEWASEQPNILEEAAALPSKGGPRK